MLVMKWWIDAFNFTASVFHQTAWLENIVVYPLEVSCLHRCNKKSQQLLDVCLSDAVTC